MHSKEIDLPNGALALAVLVELRQALRRLGSDPPYYTINTDWLGTLGECAGPSLAVAINAWTNDLAAHEPPCDLCSDEDSDAL